MTRWLYTPNNQHCTCQEAFQKENSSSEPSVSGAILVSGRVKPDFILVNLSFFFLCSQLLPTHSPLYVVFFSAVFSDTGICGMPKFSKSFERTILSPSASRTVFGENLGPATSQGVGNFFGEPEWLDSTRPKAGIWGKHHHHFKTKPGI